MWPWHLTFWPWKWCQSHVWRYTSVPILVFLWIERHRKTKIGTEVAHVTRDSDTTFKVNVTRPLCSPRRQRVRQLQRWAWERIERGNLLLYVSVHVQSQSARRREALRRPQREERGGAYCGGRPPIQLVICCDKTFLSDRLLLCWNAPQTFLTTRGGASIYFFSVCPNVVTKHRHERTRLAWHGYITVTV